MAVDLRLHVSDPTEPDVEEPFRSLAGHLMWLANQTRPDILNAVRAVARYTHVPKRVHWKAALHVLMYVRFISSYGITFHRGTEGVLHWKFSSIRITLVRPLPENLYLAVS